MQSTGQTSTHAVSLVPTHGSQMMNANLLIILAIAAALKASPPVCDPALTALFTPLRPALGRYEVCTTGQPLQGDADALEALDAFGTSGSYDRAALQRLYGGARVRVQRSWAATGGVFV